MRTEEERHIAREAKAKGNDEKKVKREAKPDEKPEPKPAKA